MEGGGGEGGGGRGYAVGLESGVALSTRLSCFSCSNALISRSYLSFPVFAFLPTWNRYYKAFYWHEGGQAYNYTIGSLAKRFLNLKARWVLNPR